MTVEPIPFIILMPVYEDRVSAQRLIGELARLLPERPHVIAVEDGSLREPLDVAVFAQAGLSGEILHLKRNMGHQQAIAVGLSYIDARYDPGIVVVMDSDGEDQPSSIPAMVARLREGGVEAVVAQRRKRSEALRFRLFYACYKFLFWLFTGRRIAFGNFTALSAAALHRLTAMQELWVHYPATLIVSRLRLGFVPTDRGKRYAGQPHMNFVSLALHGLRSIMVFAEDVLVRVGVFSVALAAGSIVLLLAAVVLKLIGFATPGWFSTAAGILFLMVLQAGVLIFVTLMNSGLFKGTPPAPKASVDDLIARVDAHRHPAEPKTPMLFTSGEHP